MILSLLQYLWDMKSLQTQKQKRNQNQNDDFEWNVIAKNGNNRRIKGSGIERVFFFFLTFINSVCGFYMNRIHPRWMAHFYNKYVLYLWTILTILLLEKIKAPFSFFISSKVLQIISYYKQLFEKSTLKIENLKSKTLTRNLKVAGK